jgi:XTP/dITP diphosphohydrolase
MATDIQILVGTQNLDKLKEIGQILSPSGIRVVSLHDFPSLPSVEETGQTYEENAVLKASAFSLATGLTCISEDSGLEVDCLHGEPGIYSGRFAGVEGTTRYQENNRKLLQKLAGVPLEKRTARFVCVVVLVSKTTVLLSCRGECRGRIIFEPRGTEGFGYDPLFEVPEYHQTFAELGSSIKNQISHRALAFQELSVQLERCRDVIAKDEG